VKQVSGMDRIVFSTDVFPEQRRFAAYRDELARWSCGLELSTPDPVDFHAGFELRRVGSLEMVIHTVSAIDTVRTPRLVRDGDDSLLVMLLLDGCAYQAQFGDQYRLNAGQAVICDSGYPGALDVVDRSKLLILKIPRGSLGARVPHVSRFAGIRLDGDPVARRLLSGYLSGAFDLDFSGSEPTARLLQDHVIDLVALALGSGGETAAFTKSRGAQAIRRVALLREIEVSSADPAFDASIAASRLGITVRYVHHLLEATGRSFSEHLLDRRLMQIERLLCDPREAQRRIADIAFEGGFGDLSYFNRMFRRKFGTTPTDVRHAAIHRRLGCSESNGA
jgi:AraC-like DNA-binding protein